MNKYTICPLYIERCTSRQRDFADVLLRFTQSNPFKVIIDDKLEIIKRYKAINDENNFCAAWIELIINESDNFHKTSINTTGSLTDTELAVKISSSVITNRKLAVRSSDDYSAHLTDIKANCIELLEPNEFRRAIEKAPEKHLNHDALLRDLLVKATRLLERKQRIYIEDLRNDDFSDFLRDRGYNICDQTRSGVSGSGKSVGELDIAIRSPHNIGVIETVIEALRLSSCGSTNSTVSSHLDKLLNRYDNAGTPRNYFLIYAESANFHSLWNDYFTYMKDINNKNGFNPKHALQKIEDISSVVCNITDIKVARATHSRNGGTTEVVHVFINFHIDPAIGAAASSTMVSSTSPP